MAYSKLHSDRPIFTLSIGEIQIRPNGPWTFDLTSYDETFSIRSTNQPILALWRIIMQRLQDGKLNDITQVNGQQAFKDMIEKENQTLMVFGMSSMLFI